MLDNDAIGIVFDGKVTNFKRNEVPYAYMNMKITGTALSYSTGPSGMAKILVYVEGEEDKQ